MREMTRAGLAASMIAASLWLVARPASGQESSEAELQYELGAEHYREGRYAEAVERFLASNRLVPNANVVFNIAQTYGLMGRPVDAFNWYETYLTQFEIDEAARARARAAQELLAREVAIVEVETSPAGAELFVDRPDLGSVGTSPRRVAMASGTHGIVARLAGHRDASATVRVHAGEVTRAVLALERLVGSLSVETTPAGATVRIEAQEEPLGETPLTAELPVGEVRLVISRRGYVEVTRTVTVRQGETATLSVSLQRAASSVAVLTVTSLPSPAAVFVDGRRAGSTPLTLDEVVPGTRLIEVAAEGRGTWSDELVLEAGAATRAAVTLGEGGDPHWRWARWIAWGVGGAVLAAGGVMGGLALTHRAEFFADENPTREMLEAVGAEALAADVLIGTGAAVLAASLVLELVLGRPRPSAATVTIDR